MTTRRKFTDNAGRWHELLKIPIWIKFLLVLLLLFLIGFLMAWNFLEIPLNDSKFEIYEQIARDVYTKKNPGLIEVPEDVNVSVTASTIILEPTSERIRGKVIARLKNGEMVMTRDFETKEAVSASIAVGGLFDIMGAILLSNFFSLIRIRREQN